jgi:di/tricarboxylate transporter
VILPVNTIPNIVFLSSGYFNQKQIVSYGLVLSAVSSALVLALCYPYWSVIGLI